MASPIYRHLVAASLPRSSSTPLCRRRNAVTALAAAVGIDTAETPSTSSANAVSNKSSDGDGFWVSTQRMQEFLDAEVTHFAGLPRKALTLEDLLSASVSPTRLARFTHREIPKRLAARISHIQQVPNWSDDDDLVVLQARNRASFNDVRIVEVQDDRDLDQLTGVVRQISERQTKALSTFRRVLSMLHRRVGDATKTEEGRQRWEAWAHKFARSRLASEMLMSQYLAIIDQVEQGAPVVTGIIDPNCDPVAVCREAARAAQDICLTHLGMEPLITIEVRSSGAASFSYIPEYLHAILLEVLRHSCEMTCQATLHSVCDEAIFEKEIHVVICADDHRVAIRVRDKAGGLPFDYVDGMWDFLSPEAVQDTTLQDDRGRSWSLGKHGWGLPYARLTAKYLGGNLSLMSLPDYGSDTHIFLPRIDVAPILERMKLERPRSSLDVCKL